MTRPNIFSCAAAILAGVVAIFAVVAVGRPEASESVRKQDEPGACFARLDGGVAEITKLAAIYEPSGCTADDVVVLAAIHLPGGRKVTLAPRAIVRCELAEALALWVREDVARDLAALGAPPATLHDVSSFECRPRNRQAGSRLSEHALANAVDIRGIGLADGRRVDFTDVTVATDLRGRLRESACARFATVLGPGSDGFHDSHIHFDLAQRRNGYRLCQWDVRAPSEPGAMPSAASTAPPLPTPRPAQAPARAL